MGRVRCNLGVWPTMVIAGFGMAGVGLCVTTARAQNPSSYSPVVIQEDFETTMARMKAAKPAVMK